MSEPGHHRVGYEDSFNLTTSLCLTYTLIVALLRGWVRRETWGSDDLIISIAVVACLGHFTSNYLTLEYGMGKPWNIIQATGDVKGLNDASIASVVTFVLSLYISKSAVVAFLLRLTKQKRQIMLYYVSLGVIATLGIASIIVVTVNWPSKSGFYWAFHLNQPSCSVQTTRWAIFTAFDILTEVILIILPLQQIWDLQMPLRKKATILTAFYLRLPVIGLSIGRHIYTQRLCSRTTDPGLDGAIVVMWLEIETSYAIVSSTFSAIKAFTENFSSGFGQGFTLKAGPESYTLSRMQRSGGDSEENSRQMPSQLGSSSSGQKRQDVSVQERDLGGSGGRTDSPIRLRPQHPGQSFSQIVASRQAPHLAHHGESKWRENGSDGSGGDDDMVIMRETEYSVQHSDNSDELPILSRLGVGRK